MSLVGAQKQIVKKKFINGNLFQTNYKVNKKAPLWTEWIESNEYRQFMTYPRLAGVAEVGWSPKGNKDLEGFKSRMEYQYKRYKALGVNYRAPGINSGNKYKAH